jgi:hypothetical protein
VHGAASVTIGPELPLRETADLVKADLHAELVEWSMCRTFLPFAAAFAFLPFVHCAAFSKSQFW